MLVSPRTCLFALVLAAATLAGCGKDRAVGTLLTATENPALKGSFTPHRIDGSWIEGSVHLENTSGKTIQVSNFQVGNNYPGFKVQVENQPPVGAVQDIHFNPWVGVVGYGANGQLTELPAGAAVDLSFKWHLLAKPSKSKGYAFTIIISNMLQDGKPVPDLTIKRAE